MKCYIQWQVANIGFVRVRYQKSAGSWPVIRYPPEISALIIGVVVSSAKVTLQFHPSVGHELILFSRCLVRGSKGWKKWCKFFSASCIHLQITCSTPYCQTTPNNLATSFISIFTTTLQFVRHSSSTVASQMQSALEILAYNPIDTIFWEIFG